MYMTESLQKTVRKSDLKLLSDVKQNPCLVCGRRPCDPCHIRSRGAGGPDTDWNVVAFCRIHHREQHDKGWKRFLTKYFHVRFALEAMEWKFEEYEGKYLMSNPRSEQIQEDALIQSECADEF